MNNSLAPNPGRRLLATGARIVGMALVLLVVTIFAIFRGLWEQSELVAETILRQANWIGGPRDRVFFWSIRVLALLLMFGSLLILSEIVSWLMVLIFQPR